MISRTTIEIELAEGTAGDDQNRILIIPWTPPSPYRRREIVQGEGERPSTMRPMRTKARAALIDALRDAQRPDEGPIAIEGLDAVTNPEQVRSQVNYMPQRFGLYEDLTACA